MIFRPELARQIRNGRKTMTRRPIKRDQPCRYQPGKSYAVQPGRGQSATCRIHITDVRHELAGQITLPDAILEGFKTTDEFKAYWIKLHDPAWLTAETAFVESCDTENVDTDMFLRARSVARFDERHAIKPVWAITFRLDTAPVGRFLALRSDELYTANPARALPNEPEAVTPDEQRSITERANMTTQQWIAHEQASRDQDRALLSREDQLVRLQRAARLRSVDISRELWALQNSLTQTNAAAFDQKVQRTEAKVFRIAA
jgi:uncharacterized protein YhfF